jgi:hypothetical protein
MGRGKFKGKPTGRRNFSTPEEIGNDAPHRPSLSFRSLLVQFDAESAAACPWPERGTACSDVVAGWFSPGFAFCSGVGAVLVLLGCGGL